MRNCPTPAKNGHPQPSHFSVPQVADESFRLMLVDDSTAAAFTSCALQRAVAKRRLYSRPVNFVAPWTYDTIGDRKRAVAARAEESGYLSGMKDEGGHHPRERRHGVRCGARAGGGMTRSERGNVRRPPSPRKIRKKIQDTKVARRDGPWTWR